MDDLRRVLATQPILADLPPEDLALLTGCASNTRLEAGTYAFREGSPSDTFYLLRSGLVAIEAHDPARGARRIQTLHAGELLGWSWLIPPYRHPFDARVVETARAVALDGACLRGKCDDDPGLGFRLMQRIAAVAVERLEATLLQLLDVYADAPRG